MAILLVKWMLGNNLAPLQIWEPFPARYGATMPKGPVSGMTLASKRRSVSDNTNPTLRTATKWQRSRKQKRALPSASKHGNFRSGPRSVVSRCQATIDIHWSWSGGISVEGNQFGYNHAGLPPLLSTIRDSRYPNKFSGMGVRTGAQAPNELE